MNHGGTSRGVDMLHWWERGLGLHRGEAGRAALLFASMFLVITSYVLGKVARDAMFLSRFEARYLPWADLSVALLIGVVFAGYLRVSRRVSMRDLLAASMVFFSANCAVLWVVAHYYRPAWLYPVFYVWVGIFGVLAPAQVWTLANYVVTVREARRAFSLVGGGAIAGWIAAGFTAAALVRQMGTENLLLVMVVLLSLSGALVLLTWRLARDITAEVDHDTFPTATHSLRGSAREVLSSAYLRAIAAVIFLSSFATTVIGWQFKAIARQFLVSKDALAVFFGEFNLFAGLLALAIQMLFAGRLLKRFGIGPVLFCLPLALLAGSAAVALSGGLVAIILLRGADQVLRYSLDKPSVELLYLPVPARLKLQVKWFIDTVVWRAGDGLAAIALLLVAGYSRFPTRWMGWLVTAVAAWWGVAAWRARRLYSGSLKRVVDSRSAEFTGASAAILGRFANELFVHKLRHGSVDEVLYTLDLVRLHRHPSSQAVVRDLLSHEAPAVRAKALAGLAESGDGSMLALARALLADPDSNVRDEAIRYLCRFSHFDPLGVEKWAEFADSSLRSGVVEFLARPGPTQNLDAARRILTAMVDDADASARVEAAQLLAVVPDVFDPLLVRLLADSNFNVVCEAVRATAALHKTSLIPVLLDRVGSPVAGAAALDALVSFGEGASDAVAQRLSDVHSRPDVRAALTTVLARIGTQKCADTLQENMLDADSSVRHAAIKALAGVRRARAMLRIDAAQLESLLVAEVYGNYRSFQILQLLESQGMSDTTVLTLLGEGIRREQDRIFHILSALYPHRGFSAAYKGLQSGNVTVHDNALEFLDSILKPPLRRFLIPLLDPSFTPGDRARLAHRLLSVEIVSLDESIDILLGSGDRKLRMCGARLVGVLGLEIKPEKRADSAAAAR